MNQPSGQTFLYRVLLCSAIILITHLAVTSMAYPVISDTNDKFNHIFAFIVLAFFADFSFPESPYRLVKILSLFVYGIIIEIIQYYIPNRNFSFFDILADLIGLSIYAVSIPYIKRMPLLKKRWE
jgi:VanZ family protein